MERKKKTNAIGIALSIVVIVAAIILYYRWDEKNPIKESENAIAEVLRAYPKTAMNVAEAYLKIDSQGAYLSERGRTALNSMSPGNIYNEQGLEEVSVIAGYKIVESKEHENIATVTIEYAQLGILKEQVEFIERKTKVRKTWMLRRMNGKWEIATRVWPYINVNVISSYLKRTNPALYGEFDRQIEMVRKKPDFTASEQDKNSVAETVATYCNDEAKGIIPATAQQGEPKGVVSENFTRRKVSEGAWIISSFKIGEVDIYYDTATVEVTYFVDKVFDGEKLKDISGTKTASDLYTLKKVGGRWEIVKSLGDTAWVFKDVISRIKK